MILLVSSLEIVHVVLPDANIFLWINASVADTAVVSNSDIKTLLPNGFSTFLTKDKPVFSDGPKYLLRNHLLRLPYFVQLSLLLFATLESSINNIWWKFQTYFNTTLCKGVFDNFILVDEPFAKALQSFKICVLVNKNLCRKLFSALESPTTFDKSFKVTSVPFLFQILIY